MSTKALSEDLVSDRAVRVNALDLALMCDAPVKDVVSYIERASMFEDYILNGFKKKEASAPSTLKAVK